MNTTYKNFLLVAAGNTAAVSARALMTQSTSNATCTGIPQNADAGATAQTISLTPGKVVPLATRSVTAGASGVVLLW